VYMGKMCLLGLVKKLVFVKGVVWYIQASCG